MPTTGVVSGTKVLLSIDGNAVACSTDLSVSMSADVIDATCKDNDGARQVLPGQKTWSVSLDAHQVWSASNQVESIYAKFWNGDEVALSWSTGVTGDPIWSGDARISQMDLTYPLNDVCGFSVTFEGNGELAMETVV